MKSFYARHFPGSALPAEFFLSNPDGHGHDQEDECWDDEDDDGLGYYGDGVKRTLTDTQISIFRHSEIQRILWREAGEYAGPIFPKSRKPSSKTKMKDSTKGPSKSKPKDSTKGTIQESDAKAKNSQSATLSKMTATARTNKTAKKPSPSAPGSNYTPPTSNKKQQQINKRKNARSAARAFKSKHDRIAEKIRSTKRANTSSPEPDARASKKVKKTGQSNEQARASAPTTEIRHNPEDYTADGEDFTFRRLARDEDDAPDVAVDLDY